MDESHEVQQSAGLSTTVLQSMMGISSMQTVMEHMAGLTTTIALLQNQIKGMVSTQNFTAMIKAHKDELRASCEDQIGALREELEDQHKAEMNTLKKLYSQEMRTLRAELVEMLEEHKIEVMQTTTAANRKAKKECLEMLDKHSAEQKDDNGAKFEDLAKSSLKASKIMLAEQAEHLGNMKTEMMASMKEHTAWSLNKYADNVLEMDAKVISKVREEQEARRQIDTIFRQELDDMRTEFTSLFEGMCKTNSSFTKQQRITTAEKNNRFEDRLQICETRRDEASRTHSTRPEIHMTRRRDRVVREDVWKPPHDDDCDEGRFDGDPEIRKLLMNTETGEDISPEGHRAVAGPAMTPKELRALGRLEANAKQLARRTQTKSPRGGSESSYDPNPSDNEF